ncbi:MAG: hypothetical protein U1F83_14360 [Verrucomicrobiota bacterium]
MPILIGLGFMVGMGFSIKTGVLNWKGGGKMFRNQEPVAFWFWILVFLVAGLFSLLIGLVELTHVLTPS